MRFTRLMLVFCLLFACLPLSGCAAAQPVAPTLTPAPTSTTAPTNTAVPTETPAPTETMTPAPTSTPEPSPTATAQADQSTSGSGAVIKTTVGDVVIVRGEIASENVMGEKAAAGYQIFNVWFKSADDSAIDGTAFYNASKGVYVVGDDGSKTNSYMGGMMSGKLLVGFTPPDKATKFTLYWPGNDPVEIVIQ